MCEDVRFFICKHCGNIISMVHSSGAAVVCCGDEMEPLVPNTTDASQEKHLPVIEAAEGIVTVKVGSVPHPMTAEHHIEWIFLITGSGRQRKCLAFDAEPKETFVLEPGEKVFAAYAYCNLHGLWKTEVK